MPAFELPDDPLSRFRQIYDELERRRSWTQGPGPLRYAALTLITCPGQPYVLADRLGTIARELRDRAGWASPMKGPARFLVAAILLRRGEDSGRFCAEVERVGELFKRRGLRRSEVHQTLAILILRGEGPDRRVPERAVERFRAIYEMMKSHHWWLTGPDDFPACALLTLRKEPVHEMGQRIEALYGGLRRLGLPRGDPLQLTSHILALGPAPTREALRRFQALHEGFRAAGIAMWSSDFDELATLSFLDRPDAAIRRVVEHREAMKGLRPRPDASQTFSLACATAFLEQVRVDAGMLALQDARAMMQVQAIVEAHQAASVASAAAAASVVTMTHAATS